MCVDGHVPGGTGQGLPLAVRNVLLCLGVAILFGHAKIDYMDDVGSLCARLTDEEVVRFDITVDEVLLVDCLHS